MARILGVTFLLLLSGCGGDYRPGVSGALPTLPQNGSSNSMPQPLGSMNR